MNETSDSDSQHQIINYSNLGDNDVNTSTSVIVTSDNVTVVPSRGDHAIGSSKVKMTNVVDYTWEQRFYTGQILAVHISGKYIAYGIQGKDSCNIRVISFATSDRALIKGIEGMAQDIAFAFILAPVLLACIDSVGDVYVYTVEENQLNALTCCLMVHIKEMPHPSPVEIINRIVWCPYVPDDESMEDDDSSKLIVTRGNKAHLWNITTVHANHNITPVSPDCVSDGFLEIKVDKYQIVDLAFSPDGSTVALACSDGGIRFFQVDVEGQNPVCIHDWRPHEGKPVSCLYFLDNHLESDAAFWKFAITGVEGNSEIKIWSCESWTCLQTFKYAPANDNSAKLKVAVDITANYILLSDMHRKLLHILQLKKNDEETGVRIHVISEFLLPYPILSFGIVEASMQNFNDSNTYNFNDDNREFSATDEKKYLKTVIKLYLVQPKALQECNIVYNPDEVSATYAYSSTEKIDVKATALLNGLCLKDGSAHSKDRDSKLITPSNFAAISSDATITEKFLSVSVIEKHMTTSIEEFKSIAGGDANRKSLDRDSLSHHVNNTAINGCEETEEDEIATDRNGDENGNGVANEGKSYYSTGSSPSREVQNILFSTADNDETCHSIQSESKNTTVPPLPVTVWPKIPIPEPDNLCSDASGVIRITGAETSKTDYHLHAVYTRMDAIQDRLNQLSEQTKSTQQDLKQTMNLLHQVLNKVEDDKKKHRNSNTDERYLQERIVNVVTQSINSIMGNEMEYVIKEGINGNVLPSLKNSMDTFGQQLHAKLTQHLTVADQQLRDHIVKTVHKKSVTDTLANALASVLPSVISNSFAESFCNIILPKFESSCHEMFDQVNNLFVEGTRDFVGVLQNNVRSYEEKQSSMLQAKIDEFIVKLDDMLKTASINAVKNVAPEIINPMKIALEEQKLYLESSLLNVSASSTGSPGFANIKRQQEEHIDYLIKQGKIDVAIEQVLSASDLKLLVCLCEKLDPEKIFTDPCLIQQHILLSFIQQLSVDLNIQTDLRHKFIEGAVMCLDKKHPVCEKNFPKILPAVRNRIFQYITMNPNNKNTRNMKILLMALDSLLDRNEHFTS